MPTVALAVTTEIPASKRVKSVADVLEKPKVNVTYGSAGFRMRAGSLLDSIAYRSGLIVALMSSIGSSGKWVGAVITASHNAPQV